MLQDESIASQHPGYVSQQATSLLYAGEYFDSDSQHYYNRARWYNPLTGLFNRVDPFAGNLNDPQSLHKYLYSHNNPANNIDPSGEFALCDIVITAAIIGAVVGLFLPAESFGERIRNSLFTALLTALMVDLMIVGASAAIVGLGMYFGVFLVSADTFVTLSMIAVGGTTFAAGAENSWFARQLSRLSKIKPWGHKTPSSQPLKIGFSKTQHPEYAQRLRNISGDKKTYTLDRTGSMARSRAAVRGVASRRGFDRDEWPMAITKEGGAGADIKYMLPSQNRAAGATIGNKLRPYPDGTKFQIEITD